MKLLKYLKSDEKKAPIEYSKLLKQLSNKKDKLIIKGIIKDERRHAKLLNTIGRKK
jgi:rubrerythrin